MTSYLNTKRRIKIGYFRRKKSNRFLEKRPVKQLGKTKVKELEILGNLGKIPPLVCYLSIIFAAITRCLTLVQTHCDRLVVYPKNVLILGFCRKGGYQH